MVKTGQRRRQEGGILLEVVIAGMILAIAAVGVSLMLSKAQLAVIGQGDRYVALYLAQQQIEFLTATVLTRPPDPTGSGFDDVIVGTSSQTLQTAGEQLGGRLQQFTRITCINLVNDDNVANPPPPGCTSCTLGGTCTGNTKRITVTVTPLLPGVDQVNPQAADTVTLVTVITKHPASNF